MTSLIHIAIFCGISGATARSGLNAWTFFAEYANDLLVRRGMRLVSMSGGRNVARGRGDALFLKTSAGGSRVSLTGAATSWKKRRNVAGLKRIIDK